MPNNVVEITFRVKNDDGGQLASLISSLGTLKSAGTAQAQENAALTQSSNVLAQAMQVLEAAQKSAADSAQGHATATKGSGEASASATGQHKALAAALSATGDAAKGATSFIGSFAGGLKSLVSTGLSELANTAGHITNIGSSSRSATTEVTALGRAFDYLKQGSLTTVAITGVVTAARDAFRLLGDGMQAVKGSFIDYNSTLQQTTIGFTTMLGSADKAKAFVSQLQDFANKTPFEFPELATASQRLLAFGFSAQQVVPLLTAVGNTAAAMGSGDEGINRLTLALGQMQAKGKVSGDELLQLQEAGIKTSDVFDIMGKASGKTGDQIAADVTKGKVSSQDFIAAFEIYTDRFNGLMDQQSHTFQGAMSTIRDTLNSAGAQAFKPFFDLLTVGADKFAQFLQTDKFKSFIDTVSSGASDAAQAVERLFKAFQSGGIDGVLDGIKAKITGFVTSLAGDAMHSGGFNVIETFVEGMYDAAQSTLTTAVTDISQLIGDFFIGHSPPPKGPLKQIHEGGAMLIAEYQKGMVEGAGKANFTEIGKTILDQIGQSLQAGGGMFGSDLADKVKTSALSMDDLKAAGVGVDDVVQELSDKLSDIADKQASIKDQEADIQDSYSAQIDPLQRQLDTLKQTVDYTTQKRDLELEIADNRIQQQEADDPTLKGLTSQLTTLQRAQRASRDAPTNRTDENAIAGLEAKARAISTPAGATAAQRQAATSEKKGIDDQIAAIRERDRVAKDGSTDAAKAQQATIDLVKQEIEDRKAGYQDQLDANKAEKDSIDLKQKGVDLQKQLQELPLQQKIDGLKRAEQDALDPLQAQSREYDKQTRLLDSTKRQWAEVKTAITDALKPLTEAETYKNQTDAQQATLDRAAATAAKTKAAAGAGNRPTANPNLKIRGTEVASDDERLKTFGAEEKKTEDSPFVTQGKKIGEQLVTGAIGYFKDNFGKLIGGAIGSAAGSFLGPAGSILGGLLGAQIGDKLQSSLKGVDFSGVTATVRAFTAEARNLYEIFTRIGPSAAFAKLLADLTPIAESLRAKLGALASEGLGKLQEAAQTVTTKIGEYAPIVLAKLGEWGQAFVNFVKPYIGPMLESLGGLIGKITDWTQSTALPAIRTALGKWADEFVHWLGPRLPDILLELGKVWFMGEKFIVETATKIGDKLLLWSAEFLGFTATHIIPWLGGKLEDMWTQNLQPWLEAAPARIKTKLQDWGQQFLNFMADHVKPFIDDKLGALWTEKLQPWLEGIPGKIKDKLAEWGKQFLNFMTDHVFPTFKDKIESLWTDHLEPWLKDQPDRIKDKLADWGKEFLNWITDLVKPENLLTKLGEIAKTIKDWAADFLKKDLPGIMGAFVDPFLAPFTRIGGAIQGGLGKLKDAVNTVGGWIGVGDIIKGGAVPAIPFDAPTGAVPRATGGIVNEQLTLLGERGPELAHLPKGTHVYTAEETEMLLAQKRGHEGNIFAWDGTNLGRGGFPGIDTIVDAAKSAGSKVFDTVSSAVKEGASALVDRATKGLSFGLPQPFSDMGGHLLGSLIGAVKENIGDLIGKLKDVIGGNNDAVNSALGMLSTDGLTWNNWCQKFVDNVRQALGFGRSGQLTALDHINAVRGSIRPGIGPPGSAEVWDFPPDGHIDVNGPQPGQGISTGAWGIQVVDQSRFGPPTGWIPINLDTGGITRGGGLYNLHPGEAVIPLDKAGGHGAALGNTEIHVHVAGSVVTQDQITEATYQGLLKKKRLNGNLGL